MFKLEALWLACVLTTLPLLDSGSIALPLQRDPVPAIPMADQAIVAQQRDWVLQSVVQKFGLGGLVIHDAKLTPLQTTRETNGTFVAKCVLSFKFGGTECRSTGFLTVGPNNERGWGQVEANDALEDAGVAANISAFIAGQIDPAIAQRLGLAEAHAPPPTPPQAAVAVPTVSAPIAHASPIEPDSADKGWVVGTSKVRLTFHTYSDMSPAEGKRQPAWKDVQTLANHAAEGNLLRYGTSFSTTLSSRDIAIWRWENADQEICGFFVAYRAADGQIWATTNDPKTDWNVLTTESRSVHWDACSSHKIEIQISARDDGTTFKVAFTPRDETQR